MTIEPIPVPSGLTPGVDAPTWPEEFAERYRRAGHWRGETFGRMLRERAAAHPDRVALVDFAPGRRTRTYRQLDEAADRLAAGFAGRGIGRGDRVVVQLPNTAEFAEVVFALFRLGALPVFALPAHRDTEITHFCAFSEAVAYVIPDVHDGFDHRDLATRVRRGAPDSGRSSWRATRADTRRCRTCRATPPGRCPNRGRTNWRSSSCRAGRPGCPS